MKSIELYLPIKSKNLPHYFKKGCVSPVGYLEGMNRGEDVQSRFGDYLLLSKNVYIDETDCSLQLVLTSSEVNRLVEIGDDLFLLPVPLPISRVKKVLFQEADRMRDSVFDVEESGAGYLPKGLLEVVANSSKGKLPAITDKELKGFDSSDWHLKLDRYNRILGGFALLKIARKSFQEYPLSYFTALSSINVAVKEALVEQGVFDSKKKLDGFIIGSAHQTISELYDLIYSKIDPSQVDDLAKEEGVSIQRKNGKIVLDSIQTKQFRTYLLAILASYGDGSRQKLDEFVSHFLNGKFAGHKEEAIALCFGINKGYQSFSNRYNFSSKQEDIKFKLDSQLDYFTIESIYQYVFYNETNNRRFDYIAEWCPEFIGENDFDPDFEQFGVFDKTIVCGKKDDLTSHWFDQFYKSISGETILGLLKNFVTKTLPSFVPHEIISVNLLQGLRKEFDNDLKQLAHDIYLKAKEELAKESESEIDKLKASHKSELETKDKEIAKLSRSRASKETTDIKEEEVEKGIQNSESTDRVSADGESKNVKPVSKTKRTSGKRKSTISIKEPTLDFDSEREVESENKVSFEKFGIKEPEDLDNLKPHEIFELAKSLGFTDVAKYDKGGSGDINALVSLLRLTLKNGKSD